MRQNSAFSLILEWGKSSLFLEIYASSLPHRSKFGLDVDQSSIILERYASFPPFPSGLAKVSFGNGKALLDLISVL